MTNFQIKIIAAITMLIDHVGVAFHSPTLNLLRLRQVGRISFPLFVFLVIEACLHTKDIKRYMGRLFLFAFISQIPFAWLAGVPVFSHLNIFFTLFLGVFFVYLYKIAIENGGIVSILFFIVLFVFGYIIADINNFEYGGYGLMFIMIMYIARGYDFKYKRVYTAVALVVMSAILYPPFTAFMLPFFIWAVSSMIPIYFYNGELGYNTRLTKWIFYLFYPVHLLFLVWLRG